MINDILNNINLNSDEAILKEYKALYNKLSKKYKDQQLDFEIKQRLYRKGYSSEEINTIKED
jgi:SOS response regulatory protein OraA/RecX